MIPDHVWLALAVATVPAVILDMASGMIQRRQIRVGGGEPGNSFGPVSRFLLSLVLNAVVLGGLVYAYYRLWGGSGGAYLFCAVAWLLLSIPALLLSRAMDESQQHLMTIRTLSLLFKAAALSMSLAHFIG